MRLQFEFGRERAPLRYLLWSLAALLAVAVGISAVRYISAVKLLKIENARLSASDQPAEVASTRSATQQAQFESDIKAAQEVIAKLAIPWYALLREVSLVSSKDVGLLGIEPDSRAGNVKILAEARNANAMLIYVERLAKGTALGDVHLAEHSVSTQDVLQPVRFTVLAKWRPLK